MIDIHLHPFFINELKKPIEEWKKIKTVFFTESQVLSPPMQPLRAILSKMDAANIQKAVLLPIDCRRARGVSILTNQDVEKICSLSDRFIGFASIDPLDSHSVEYLVDAHAIGLRGLKLDPGLQLFEVKDVIQHPMWKLIEKWKWPVMLHVGYSFVPHVSMYSCTVKDVEILVDTYPKINFVAAHWGYPNSLELCLTAIKYPNLFIDTSAFYYDSPSKFHRDLFKRIIPLSMVEKSLRHQICFGSNAPKVYIQDMRIAIEELPLSDKTKLAIFQSNTEKLLNQQ